MTRRPARLAAPAALLLALAAGGPPARAEVAADPGALPPITVRPSGVEDPGAEARARQERLSRKLDRSEFVLRHICTHCMGPPPAPTPDAPARPAASLAPVPGEGAAAQP